MSKRKTLPSGDRDWSFSRAVKAIRAERGMSAQELATIAHLSISAVAKYETATVQPTWPVAIKIIEALKVDVAEFVRRSREAAS